MLPYNYLRASMGGETMLLGWRMKVPDIYCPTKYYLRLVGRTQDFVCIYKFQFSLLFVLPFCIVF